MKETKNWTKWIYWFTLGVALIFIYKTVDGFADIASSLGKFLGIVSPFFLAILVAYLFYIPCRSIERIYIKTKMSSKFSRFLSVITVYILAILFIGLLLNIILPAISRSVIDLANHLPTYYNEAIAFVDNMPEDSLIDKEYIQNIIVQLEEFDITQFVTMENISDYINSLVRSSKHYFRNGYNFNYFYIYITRKK
jgi:predicted PurR-regulated permease PerM